MPMTFITARSPARLNTAAGSLRTAHRDTGPRGRRTLACDAAARTRRLGSRMALIVTLAVMMLATACADGNPPGTAEFTGSSGSGDADNGTGDAAAGSDDADASDNGTGDTTADGDDADPGDDGAGDPGDTTADNGTGDAAAGSDDADPGDNGDAVVELSGDDVVLTAGLVRFNDCDTLLDYLHAEYSARVGPYGFGEGGWFGPVRPLMMQADDEMAVAEPASAESSGAVSDAPATTVPSGAGVDFSGTNVQEAGVDEADIVKTDGERIFTVSSGRLVVVDVPGRGVVGSVAVAEGWGREMFIDGDGLLLITHSRNGDTVLQSIDVGGGDPRILETTSLQGRYVSARSVGGTAQVILRYDPQQNFPFVYPQNEAAEKTATEANRNAVLNSTLDDWLPHHSAGSTDPSEGSLLVPCGDVHAPSVFSGFGVTAVISVPVGGAFDPSASTAVMAPGDTVYASTASLYVATTRWLDSDTDDEDAWRRAWSERRTSIHRFSLGTDKAAYESSGEVFGVLRNQFSLSEHDGYLRVVTTVGDPWGEESESQVRVLSTDSDTLVEVGSVGDIGRGEQVQSVRFVGDVGYVVTFRQIDPFYTIDLSDPTDPRILGELKIPGFSSYLHPISDTQVLGVGSDADADGRVTGAKVSLFDVSDLATPREVAVWTAPDGWNNIGWDHRAFLWWAPENLAVIPVIVHNDWAGAVVLRVADGAITEVGRVDHLMEGEEPGVTDCRQFTPADLPTADMESFTTELEYMVSDDYGAVLACEPGESGMTGFECRDEPFFVEEAASLDLIRGEESVSICWPNDAPNTIVRSIVIRDELWTLGFKGWGGFDGQAPARLHVHDLQTLERLEALSL